MIHVTRGTEPPVPREKNEFIAAYQASQNLSRVENKIRRYYLPALNEVFKNKCAYCETRLDASSQAIDQFKPKRLYPDLIWAWGNLYPCCMVCNAHKRDIDPVDRKSGEAWLIDPCADDPETLLSFQTDGFVVPRKIITEKERERAIRTIAALGLNRDNLVSQRLSVISDVDRLAHIFISRYPDKWQHVSEFQQFASKWTAADAPFAAAARDRLRQLACREPKDIDMVSDKDASAHVSLNGESARIVSPEKHFVNKVTLKEIGPFSNLELQLGPGWNLLLGNNGCGKSTLLRAIAMALAGSDKKAAIAAPRLLRAGAEAGTIALTTDHYEYRSSLARVRGDVDLDVEGLTLVVEGKWLTLAFPAVRGYSSRAVLGPTIASPSTAGAHDLLPILDDVADPRMDDTRQWLVNTVLRAEGNENEEVRTHHRWLCKWWFKILGKLMPGLDFEFERLDRETWQVLVRTADGIIPMEHSSLGMVSTIGWIGTLLRRLAEAYPHSKAPEQESALVLIDEIDAHLHPSWQKQLVPLVRELFPNIQIVAASHSALIANNLEPQEIIILSRDAGGHLVTARMNERVKGLRADQVLTSAAFGLDTTRSKDIDELLRDFQAALAEDDGTTESKARVAALRLRVRQEVSLPPETTTERNKLAAELQAADEAIRERLRESTPEELQELKKMIAAHRTKSEAP